MNNWCITGNLTRDAEVKVLQSGASVCSFGVAVNSGYGDKKTTLFPRCTMWGKRAEGNLPQYLTKGTKVAVTGELSENKWTNADSIEKVTLELNVATIDLIGSKPTTMADNTGNGFNPNVPDDTPF